MRNTVRFLSLIQIFEDRGREHVLSERDDRVIRQCQRLGPVRVNWPRRVYEVRIMRHLGWRILGEPRDGPSLAADAAGMGAKFICYGAGDLPGRSVCRSSGEAIYRPGPAERMSGSSFHQDSH